MSNDSNYFFIFPLLYILLQNPRLGTADFAILCPNNSVTSGTY